MKNFLKNLYTKFEKNSEHVLTPQEQAIADSVNIFLSHEINEMKNIIIEEQNAQKESEKDPESTGRPQYDIETMTEVLSVLGTVHMSIGMLISMTAQAVMSRSQSNIARVMLTPQDLCHAKSERKLDMSTISPVHPHEIQMYKGNFPESFKISMRRIHKLIEQENVFGVFAPIYPLLGKSIQKLYIITRI